MSYKAEMRMLVLELEEKARAATDDKERELSRRRAEVLDFLINHPDDALGILKHDE